MVKLLLFYVHHLTVYSDLDVKLLAAKVFYLSRKNLFNLFNLFNKLIQLIQTYYHCNLMLVPVVYVENVSFCFE